MRRSRVTLAVLISAVLTMAGVLGVASTSRSRSADVAAAPAPSPVPSGSATTDVTVGRPVVVVLGASIAAGYRTGTAAPWPRQVDDLLLGQAGAPRVVDASISATRMLIDTPAGPSFRSRLPAALAVPGVRAILVTDLINDIQAAPHIDDPAVIEAGLRGLVDQARQRGIAVIATTMTPYGGYHYTDDYAFSPDGEACRQAVNAALRGGGLVDQVVDFDLALADPTDPLRLDPLVDSGDHLHPNDAGHLAMSRAVARALTRPGG